MSAFTVNPFGARYFVSVYMFVVHAHECVAVRLLKGLLRQDSGSLSLLSSHSRDAGFSGRLAVQWSPLGVTCLHSSRWGYRYVQPCLALQTGLGSKRVLTPVRASAPTH